MTPDQFGNPVGSTDYTLCVFDDVDRAPTLQVGARVRGGSFCRGRPCWKRSARGYKYRDKVGWQDGLRKVTLKAGRRAKIHMDGRGLLLPVPRNQPLRLPARVELRASTGTCWASTFRSARRNDKVWFKAKGG
jgi:hypothetical protein